MIQSERCGGEVEFGYDTKMGGYTNLGIDMSKLNEFRA